MKYLIALVFSVASLLCHAQVNNTPLPTAAEVTPSLVMKELHASVLHEDIDVGMLVLFTKGWAFIDHNLKIEIFPLQDEPELFNTFSSGAFDKRQYSFFLAFRYVSESGWRLYGNGHGNNGPGVNNAPSFIMVRTKNYNSPRKAAE